MSYFNLQCDFLQLMVSLRNRKINLRCILFLFTFQFMALSHDASWVKKKKVTILVVTTRKGSSELRSAGAIKQFASVSELFAYVENQQAT